MITVILETWLNLTSFSDMHGGAVELEKSLPILGAVVGKLLLAKATTGPRTGETAGMQQGGVICPSLQGSKILE